MNRFRGDQRLKDRWGSGFVVLAILMLVGAYFVGDYYAKQAGALPDELQPASSPNEPGMGTAAGASQADLTGFPRPLTVFMVQAGAFTDATKAAQHAQTLSDKGFPAAVSQSGKWHKVFIGAYRTKEAAQAIKTQAETASGLTFYTPQVDLASAPTVLPATTAAGAATDFQDAVAALSGYLHESSSFWDGVATGKPAAADRLNAFSQRLSAATAKLRSQAGDPAISRLLSLADKVNAASLQQAGLAANPAPEQQQAAMQNYLAVVDEYRAWTDTANQP